MKWYKWWPGDYASATPGLTWLQDLAYRRLLDAYYASNAPLTCDGPTLYRTARARTKAQREAVDFVILTYFDLDGDVYRNAKADAIIGSAMRKSEKASESARARWKGANAMRTHKRPHSERTSKGICDRNATRASRESQNQTKRARADGPPYTKKFESEFWPPYPRKTGKAAAARAFDALGLKDRVECVAGVRAQVGTGKLNGTRFTPHPATWINQRRWEDDPQPAPDTKTESTDDFDEFMRKVDVSMGRA